MSTKELPFISELKATGHGEVWEHTTDQNKFRQFGWRCTTNETSYSNDTLIGNWNEQRFDIHRMFRPEPMPSSVSLIGYFDMNYGGVSLRNEEQNFFLKRWTTGHT